MSEPKGKESGLSRSGDLWHYLFGDGVKGGVLYPNYKGRGKDHISVFGGDRRFSWDVDIQTGEISGVHGRTQKPSKPGPW